MSLADLTDPRFTPGQRAKVREFEGADPDGLRAAVADERNRHVFEWHQRPGPVARWIARCACRNWEEGVADDSYATVIHRNWQLHTADALLAGPLAPLLDRAAKAEAAVARVEALADELTRDAWNICGTEAARAKTNAGDRIRRAIRFAS